MNRFIIYEITYRAACGSYQHSPIYEQEDDKADERANKRLRKFAEELSKQGCNDFKLKKLGSYKPYTPP